jgi:hypothetical protein
MNQNGVNRRSRLRAETLDKKRFQLFEKHIRLFTLMVRENNWQKTDNENNVDSPKVVFSLKDRLKSGANNILIHEIQSKIEISKSDNTTVED